MASLHATSHLPSGSKRPRSTTRSSPKSKRPQEKTVASGSKNDSAIKFEPWLESNHPSQIPRSMHVYSPVCSLADSSSICTTSPPCNNPTCDDVVQCPNAFNLCDTSDFCAGYICYDKNCADRQDADIFCDQGCEEETQCASPCYSQDCNEPPCDSPCPDNWRFPWTQSYLANLDPSLISHDTAHCTNPQCIDPRCLSQSNHATYGSNNLSNHSTARDLGFGNLTYDDVSFNPSTHHQPDFNLSYPSDENSWLSHAYSASQPYIPGQGLFLGSPQTHTTTFRHPEVTKNPTYPYPSPSSFGTNMTPRPSSSISRGLSSSASQSDMPMCKWTDGSHTCGKIFESTTLLQEHVEKAHVDDLPRDNSKNNGFLCQWAGCSRSHSSSFSARPKLKRHVQIHTGHKPFQCKTCGVQMKTKDALEKHERTHTGDRPYACTEPGCGKVFATSTELKTHRVVHSGSKPHICPICGGGFADSSNLSKHKKTHFVGMYQCPEPNCDACMKRWDQLKRHLATSRHAPDLLNNLELQGEYKRRMEEQYMELPDEARILLK